MRNNLQKEKFDNLENSLEGTITSDNLKEISIEGAELALDSFLSDGIFKQLPFFGILYKGFKAFIGIREAIFAKKVFKFLIELKDIPTQKRKKFINNLKNDNKYNHKVGEKLIIIIEHLDDIEKAQIIGKLFKATITEFLDYETFLKLSAIVQNSFLPDLLKLRPENRKKHITPLTQEHFNQLGIMSLKLDQNTRERYIMNAATVVGSNKSQLLPVVKFELNKLGEKLIKFGLTNL